MNKKMVLTAVYALTLILFGVLGFVKTKSLPSLIAGGGAGVLLLAFLGLSRKKTWAKAAPLYITALMTVLFAIRFFVSGKMVPLLLGIFSLAVLVTLWKK